MEEREIKVMAVPPIGEGMKIVCLKSEYNNKFLRYRYEGVRTHGLLQFAADKVMDPYAQFEVEYSTIYTGDVLVHLKSRFNNKYLVRWSPDHNWITASANKVNEDQSNWSCTLFKPIYFDDNDNTQKMRLLHVQLGHYACLWRLDVSFDSCLFAGSEEIDKENCDVFSFVNWESLFNLPKRVAFKGQNGKYLGVLENEGVMYLHFSYNFGDPKVVHEIFEALDGTLCIKSNYVGKFWRLTDYSYIVVDEDDPRGTSNTFAMFRHVVRDVNVIALLNMNETFYCTEKYTNIDEIISENTFLNATSTELDKYGIIELIDLGT